MKIVRKPVKGIVECPLCNCVFEIVNKDWRKVQANKSVTGKYGISCPNCRHTKNIEPGEVKCKK